MKISKSAQKAMKMIQKWQEEYRIYDIEIIHDLDFNYECVEVDYLQSWFDFFCEEKEGHKFVECATHGNYKELDFVPSYYYLWFYPTLKGEPPVVYRNDEGKAYTIAPTLQDFVCLLAAGKILDVEGPTKETLWTNTISEEIYNCFIDVDDEDQNTLEAVKELMADEILELQDIVSQKLSCRDADIILSDLKKVPDFAQWLKECKQKYQTIEDERLRIDHIKHFAYIDNNAASLDTFREKMRVNLPPHFQLPPEFDALCDWGDGIDWLERIYLTGEYCLYNGDEFFMPWEFYNSVVDRFGLLLTSFLNGFGESIALWRDDDDKDWVVLIDPDIDKCFIVNHSIQDLFALLAVGYSGLSRVKKFTDTPMEVEQKYEKDLFQKQKTYRYNAEPDFKEWVKKTYQISIPETGDNLIYKGENHFRTWLYEKKIRAS